VTTSPASERGFKTVTGAPKNDRWRLAGTLDRMHVTLATVLDSLTSDEPVYVDGIAA